MTTSVSGNRLFRVTAIALVLGAASVAVAPAATAKPASTTAGYVRVYNAGGYVMRMTRTWHSTQTYKTDTKSNIAISQSDSLDVPADVSTVDVQLEVWGKSPASWSVFKEFHYDGTVTKCFRATGPVWSPDASEVDC